MDVVGIELGCEYPKSTPAYDIVAQETSCICLRWPRRKKYVY